MPVWLRALLLLLWLSASVGWLFVGRPARSQDAIISPPPLPEAALLADAAVRGVGNLRASNTTKDRVFRILIAVAVGAMLAVWHVDSLRVLKG
jgi:hypothetical protein